MAEQFDLVVIGGGPGGYIAAIRAAQLGFPVACVDDWSRVDGKPAPGGTCVNVGCIPSKALLRSPRTSSSRDTASPSTASACRGSRIDLPKMLARKDGVVAQNNDGIVYLFKKNKVTFFHGVGRSPARTSTRWRMDVAGARARASLRST